MTNQHLVAIDNADTKVSWLEDRLATAATGGTIKRRALYTTNQSVEFPIRAFIGITSRTNFRRDDVADRLLVFKLLRRETFTPESRLLAQLAEARDRIMTEIAYELQRAVRALAEQADSDCSGEFRMADFADFATRLATAQGRGPEMKDLLHRIAGQQVAFAREGEPLIGVIEAWLEADPANAGREPSTADLHTELWRLAERAGLDYPCTGARSLGQRLGNIAAQLQDSFEFASRPGHAGVTLYSFRRKEGGEAAPLSLAA